MVNEKELREYLNKRYNLIGLEGINYDNELARVIIKINSNDRIESSELDRIKKITGFCKYYIEYYIRHTW
jgi:hypothetical protein